MKYYFGLGGRKSYFTPKLQEIFHQIFWFIVREEYISRSGSCICSGCHMTMGSGTDRHDVYVSV
jgi:hypothetical protein